MTQLIKAPPALAGSDGELRSYTVYMDNCWTVFLGRGFKSGEGRFSRLNHKSDTK